MRHQAYTNGGPNDRLSTDGGGNDVSVTVHVDPARAHGEAVNPWVEAHERIRFDATGDPFTTALRASQTCDCCDPEVRRR